MRIIKIKGVQDSIQALQAQSLKKDGGSNKFKGKFDKTHEKKSWSNSIRIRSKIDLLNPRKWEEETIERTKKIRKICNVITVKSGDTWPRIVGTEKTRDRQERKKE